MKRITLHIISLSLAYLFLTVGSGVNVTDYCCSLCAEQGTSMFTSNSCEEVHAHHNHHGHAGKPCCEHHYASKKQAAGTNYTERGKRCELHRLSLEEPTVEAQLILTHFSFVAVIFTQEPSDINTQAIKRVDFSCLKAPPKSGRNILSKISMLTI